MLISRYRSKPLSWWLQTPLYAARILKHQWDLRVGKKLTPFKSQNGEDKELLKLFPQRGGICVEVGALDGIDCSNTYFFNEKRGWKCLLVEADPDVAAKCAENRPRATTVSAAAVSPEHVGRTTFSVIEHQRSMSSLSFDQAGVEHFEKHGVEFLAQTIEIDARTVDSMLEDAGFLSIDFITIDVEGHELGVLKGLDLARWQPRCVVLERIQNTPDPEIVALMEEHGYSRIFNVPRHAVSDCNDFWFKERATS